MADEETTVSTSDTTTTSDEADAYATAQLAHTEDLAQKAATGEAEAEPQTGRIAQLEQQLTELEQKLAKESEQATEYMNRYQRIQADFVNFKRRAQQEQEQRDALVAAQVISLFLPALDSFERAFATLPPSLLGYSWIDGISLVLMEMRHALQVQGVQQIEVDAGQAFDPLRHESIGEVESNEYPEGHIAVVLQSGYEVQGRTLRPTLVQLAQRPAAAAAAAAADAANISEIP